MAVKPITVSQLNDYIGRILITDPLLNNVTVKGETSGVKYHSTGHVYFSIIDDHSKLNCFLPKEYAQMLEFRIDDGMEVTIIGSVNVFKKNGTYSVYVKQVDISGEGSLYIAFEKLKKQLNSEGLFDQKYKKIIPKFPSKIGVVTSPTGAAVRDILKIIKTRNNIVDVMVFPVLVQGKSAASDIADMLTLINRNFSDLDLLIVGRGGGSLEDLWPFNEEILARAVFDSEIPIISAVGHEIDFTICDMVADLRAETPTAAAQIAVPDISLLKEKVIMSKEQLFVQLSNKLRYNKLLADNLLNEIKNNIHTRMIKNQTDINRLKIILEENSPGNILKSGYSVVENSNGNMIRSYLDANTEDDFKIQFSDGYGICKFTRLGSDKNGKK